MDRPPASHDSGEHVLSSGSSAAEPPRPPRRRRDSGDRISFDSIARLVQPSMPPRSYDTLTPVAKSDLRPPGMPTTVGAGAPPSPRRGVPFAVKVVSAVAAVALGAGLSAVLGAEPDSPPPQTQEQVVAGAALAPVGVEPSDAPEAVAPAQAAQDEVAQLEQQVLPAEAEQALPEAEERRRDDDRAERERAHDTRRGATSPEPGSEPDPSQAEPAAIGVAEAEAGSTDEGAPEPEPVAEQASEEVAEAPATELPPHPTREDVQRTMLGALPAIRECAAGQNGTVEVEVTAGSSGRVRNAVITGTFAGTPEGSCMAREMRRVRFPRFTQESFTVRYPFRI